MLLSQRLEPNAVTFQNNWGWRLHYVVVCFMETGASVRDAAPPSDRRR